MRFLLFDYIRLLLKLKQKKATGWIYVVGIILGLLLLVLLLYIAIQSKFKLGDLAQDTANWFSA